MPSSTKTILIWMVVALAVGYTIGHANPKVKVETVEVTKSIPIKVTKTVETRIPLPQSCFEVADKAKAVNADDSKQTKAVGDIKLALASLGRETFTGDVMEVNRLIEAINKQKTIIDESAVGRDELRSALENAIERCEQDMQR